MKFPNWMRLAVKSSASAKVMLQALAMPGPIPHLPYGALAKESYERNVTAYLCVHLIATNGSAVPWVLMQKGTTSTSKTRRIMTKETAYRSQMFRGERAGAVQKSLRNTEIENHPLLTLLERPNEYEAQAEYMNRLISFFLISGNTYEEFVQPNRKNALPEEMYSLRPDRVEIVPNTPANRREYPELAAVVAEDEFLLGYVYSVNDDDLTLAPASMLHRKFFHPTNDYYGLSPLQVAARYYRTDNLSADWNYALLQNQARPSGALIAPTTIGDDTYERLKQELADNYGGDNTGVPMILEGGFDWKALGLTPLEMDWLAGTRDARSQVCATYHVPPEMTGDPEHRTYNSMPEARRALWQEAILPVLDCIRDSYNRHLVPRWASDLYLDYDRDQIDALSEDQEMVWKRINAANMLTVNEKRDAIGYDDWQGDPENDPEADIPQSLIPRLVDNAVPFGGEPGGGTNPEPPKSVERKAQRFTNVQKLARKRLRSELASHYRKQGKDLAAFLRREIEKL